VIERFTSVADLVIADLARDAAAHQQELWEVYAAALVWRDLAQAAITQLHEARRLDARRQRRIDTQADQIRQLLGLPSQDDAARAAFVDDTDDTDDTAA